MADFPSKVLVAGGAGFIGSHVVEALLERGAGVGVIDNFATGEKNNLISVLPRIAVHQGDIRDEEFVRSAVKGYEAVVDEAALVSVTRSVEDPALSNSVNVEGTVNLLTASKDAGVKKFVYASSSSVYGESLTLPKEERMKPAPISPYAVSKLAGEHYCSVFAKDYGLSTVSLRYFNVYGPRQKPGPYSGVIPTFIKSVEMGKPPMVYGDGHQTRDFTFVRDVVQANLLSLQAETDPGDIFNVAGGKQTSIEDLATMIARLMGRPDLTPLHAQARPGDVMRSLADISKAGSRLGYFPKSTLEEGLRETIGWFAKGHQGGLAS